MTSLLTPSQVEALIASGLTPVALQGIIDREEDWLATDPVVGIGQLIGVRTQRIWIIPGSAEPLLLKRPTDEFGGQGSGGSLVVEDAGVERTDVILSGPARIEALNATWAGPFVEAIYAPIDQSSVERALFDLIRLTITASPYQAENSEGHSYTRPQELQDMREAIARSLDPHRGNASVVLGTGQSHRITSRMSSWS